MVATLKCLKLLIVLTFAFAVVTLIRNMEYVIVFQSQHPKIVNSTKGEEKPNLDAISFDAGTCAVVTTFHINESHMADSRGCKVPSLDPFHPYVMQHVNHAKPLRCKGRLFTEYENNDFRLLDDVNEEHQVANIFAEPIHRNSDLNVKLGEKKILNLTNRVTRINGADFLKVTVRFKNGKEQTDYHASISEILDVAQRKETHSAPLNIMILAMDRTSAAHFQRMLPKTYALLRDELDSIMFKSYSIVGENTTPALSALMTGKSLDENCEFREARKGFKNAGFVDEWPFIFKDLKDLGIATMWSEDQPRIGAFHLRLKGFKDQPSDHYGRTLWLEWEGLCKNSQTQYELQLKYLKSFMESYPGKRKFGFLFLSDLCHRSASLLSAGDDGFVAFFKSLKNESLLNETMFITMSDHGPRYMEIRKSSQGKLEHRLPFLSLTFPPWFKRKYPEHIAAMVKNTRIISSPFDLYATMKHLLAFPDKRFVDTAGIGKSLFEPLPEGRTCTDAGIPDNYCPCLRWQPIDISHPHVHEAVKVALSHINKLLVTHPMTDKLCHQLELKTIFEAYQKMPSNEADMFLSEQGNNTCSYQIKFQTTPGDGLFEGLLKMNTTAGELKVYNEIDRVNMYGDQPKCIVNHVPSMRPYCLCK